MPRLHLIGDAVFDITFDSMEGAREQEHELALFIKERLLPLAEEVFDELAGDDATIRIDQLEVDLGDIGYSGFHEEMESRFKEKLRTILQEKIRSLTDADSSKRKSFAAPLDVTRQADLHQGGLHPQGGGRGSTKGRQSTMQQAACGIVSTGRAPQQHTLKPDLPTDELASAEGIFSAQQVAREHLENFLVSGRMGLSAAHETKATPDEMLERAMLHDAEAFIAFLRNTPQQETAVRRLVKQFSEQLQNRVVQLLAPEQANILEALLNDYWQKRQRDQMGAGAFEFKSSLRGHLILALLKAGGNVSDVRRLFAEIAGADFPESAMSGDVLADMGGGAPDVVLSAPPAEMESGTDAGGEGSLRARLEAAWLDGQLRDFGSVWEELRLNHAGLVRDTFMRRIADAGAQKKLAENFPELLLWDLVSILAPQESFFIGTQAKRFGAQSGGSDRVQNLLFWQDTLRYLHALLSSGADRQDYLRDLLRDRAASERGWAGDGQAGSGADFKAEAQHPEYPHSSALVVGQERPAPTLADTGRIAGRESAAQASDAIAEKDSSREDAAEMLVRDKLLRARLEEALVLGQAEGIGAIWGDLIAGHAAMIREVFLLRMGDEILRDRLVRGFSPKMLHELIRVLFAGENGFISRLAEQFAADKGGSEKLVATGDGVELADLIFAYWQHALGYAYEMARGELGRSDAVAPHEQSGFKRDDYVRSLRSYFAVRGLPQIVLEQAIKRADTMSGSTLSEQADTTAGTHGEMLYRRLLSRLSGAGQEDAVPLVNELARAYPVIMQRLFRQLQAGEVPVQVGVLGVLEAKRLVHFLIGPQQSGAINEFQRAVAANAGKAENELSYYRHILDRLIQRRSVDLDAALDAAQAGQKPGAVTGMRSADSVSQATAVHIDPLASLQTENGERELLVAGLLRGRLEQAMVQGRADGIADVWRELTGKYGDMVRDVFIGRMGDEGAREKLVQGFPEAMLYDLLFVLLPQEYLFIKILGSQPELQARRSVSRRAGKSRIWSFTLGYLHSSRLSGYRRNEYTRGLSRLFVEQGVAPEEIARAIVRTVTMLKDSGTAAMRETARDETGTPDETDGAAAESARYATLYRQLLERLRGKQGARECVQELIELSGVDPDGVMRLYRQLQEGAIEPDVASLTLNETRLHIETFFVLSHGQAGIDFKREIDMHAGSARNPQRYYHFILNSLLRNHVVDIEAALDAAQHEADTSPASGTDEHAGLLRMVLESALETGNSGVLGEIWAMFSTYRAELVRDVFRSRLADAGVRQKLVRGFPETMLVDIVKLLSDDGGFIEKLAGMAELRREGMGKNEVLWLHTLGYLNDTGFASFDKLEYVRGLIPRLAGQKRAQGALLKIAEDIAVARGHNSPDDAVTSAGKNLAFTPEAVTSRADELYGRLRGYLSGRASRGVPGIEAEIVELARDFRAVFAQLIQELQAGKIAANIAYFSVREAAQFVFAIVGSEPGEVQNSFLVAIKARAQTARDERLFYQYILDKLIRQQVVDLDEAAGERAPQSREMETSLGDELSSGAGRALARQGSPEHTHSGLTPDLQDAGMEGKQAGMAAAHTASITGAMTAPVTDESERGESLYRSLRARLSGAGHEDATSAIDELARDYPEVLQRVFRQLQTGAIAMRAGGVSARETMRLVRFFTRLQPNGAGSEFWRAIETYAAKAKNEQSFYFHILDKLILQQVVDLEEAADGGAQQTGNGINTSSAELSFDAGRVSARQTSLQRDAATGLLPQDGERGAGDVSQQHPLKPAELPGTTMLGETQASAQAETSRLGDLLDVALRAGETEKIVAMWGMLRNRAALVREVFMHRMAAASVLNKLAEDFSETMLGDLLRILAPAESAFIEALIKQPALRTRGEFGDKNTLLWKHALAYLHATADDGVFGTPIISDSEQFVAGRALARHDTLKPDLQDTAIAGEAALPSALALSPLEVASRDGFAGHVRSWHEDYARSVMSYLTARGLPQAEVVQAIGRVDPALGKALSGQDLASFRAHEDVQPGEMIPSAEDVSDRGEILYRSLLARLSRAGHEDAVSAIDELARDYSEILQRVFRQLQAGEVAMRAGGLSAGEASRLVRFFIGSRQGGAGGEFGRAIAAHAAKAKNEQSYYRHILESLLHGRDVDLEAAANAQESRNEQPVLSPEKFARSENTTNKPAPLSGRRETPPENAEEIYIANAGLVLVSPYLPQLFNMLALTADGKFKDERSAERAVHLLQFIVNESCDSPEFLLVLNKIFCGVPGAVPIVREIKLLAQEKEAVEGMLAAIIRNWTIIGNTSIQGLRESFLQRAGRLQLKEDSWHLKVETKGIDVLLDRLPWSFAIIKHPWMTRAIYVEWR